MKKQLLTTTALVATGVLVLSGGAIAADKMMKPSLKISGVFEQGIGVQSVDGADDKVLQQQDGEIHFTASVKLDNGITVSGHAQLESDTENFGGPDDFEKPKSTNKQWIDESYMSLKGSFGQINIGSTDGASYKMVYGYMGHVGTAAGNLNLEFDSGLAGVGVGGGRALPRLPNDDRTVVYYTPRISGLQAGVSYAQTDKDESDMEKNTDIVSAAVNYTGKFGDAGVGAAVGYIAADEGADGGYDTTVMSGGVKVTMGGFTVAAGVVRNTQDGNMAAEDHTRSDVGLRYKFGPNTVRVGYIQHSDDTVEKAGTVVTFARSLGPGVTWSLDALMNEEEKGGAEKSGSFFGTSIKLKF